MRFEDLPFVKVGEDGHVVSTWNVTATANYTDDCRRGRQMLLLLLAVAQQQANPLLIQRVLEGMSKHDTNSGVEVGFRAALAQELIEEVLP